MNSDIATEKRALDNDEADIGVPSSSKTSTVDDEKDYFAPLAEDFRVKQTFRGWTVLYLAYQSVGVIYGDIGTSPLYVYSSTFTDLPPLDDLLGALSLIIWTLTLVVTIKYVTIVLHADDEGEGGTFALFSLLSRYANLIENREQRLSNIEFKRHPTIEMGRVNKNVRNTMERSSFFKNFIYLLSVMGVCMVISDGILTPAQSVLGAVQGLTLVDPNISQSVIVGVTCVILILLFLGQRFGTSKVASAFAPVIVIWLLFNLVIGIYNLAKYDYTVLKAFNPYWGYLFFANNRQKGWIQLGGILLAFTGVEALFADIGHFSQLAVQISWTLFAYPCLLIAYIGQAAYISVNPSAYSNPFFATVPASLFWLSFVLAILASIVASQAMISGTFSILHQAIAMNNFPPVRVRHTSAKFQGQVYIPSINWVLMVGTVVVTAIFQNTTSLGNAYGSCVTFVTLFTTILVALVTVVVWRWNIFFSIFFFGFFGLIDGAYLSSTLFKIPQGAWLTILLAVILSSIMFIWHSGKVIEWAHELTINESIDDIVVPSSDPSMLMMKGTNEILTRMDGVGIYYDQSRSDLPPVYSHFVRTFAAVHKVVVFVTFRAASVPYVPAEERIRVRKMKIPTFYRILIRHGYADQLESQVLGDVILETMENYLSRTAAANEASRKALEVVRSRRVTYVIGKTDIVNASGSPIPRKAIVNLYNMLRANTGRPKAVFDIPTDKMVQVGMVYKL